ncbi:MAG: CPBP family intramembrane metalloprotease, partial [Candidatus Bathyarchaeota archaeon]|nr:CPBP family intramembrane metalloprotease [Candidatus Bathyarchaeota archaeon]
MSKTRETRQAAIGVTVSFVLWYIVFLTEVLGNFWYRVTLASMKLALYAYLNGKSVFRDDFSVHLQIIVRGLLSGLLLYLLFYVGYNVLESLMIGGAQRVYLIRADSSLSIAAVLLPVTSFCEEFFWRRYIQVTLINRVGTRNGVIIASLLYSLIHIT